MAEVILSPLLEVAVGSLVSMIQDEVSLVWGVKQELENLSSTLSAVKSVLKDAEEKQMKNNSVRDWLKKLKDVAYEVDNVLDEYATEASRWKLAEHTTDSCNMQVSNFLPCICFKKVFFRRSIGHKIRGINDRLSKIAEERRNFHLREGVPERNAENIRETYSFVDEKTILGRESEKKKIVDLLLSSDDMVDVFVIPIVGLGGLGKTTLAKFVYNDNKVETHFQLRMWVCVSEEFEIKRLVKLMIESPTHEDLSLETLQRRLRETLRDRRFLLVLDDVWNDDQGKWESLKHLLRGGEKGSRIIVTTRSRKVSEIMGTTSSIHLEGLSDDECWSLMKERAFGKRIEEVVQPNLVAIGMEIARKCRGVPLAAKTLGSLLRFKRAESEWSQIRDNETWSYLLEENEDGNILKVLRISYDHLPSHLKQCFTYCSLFPKDYVMGKGKLIKRWMAQGFIQQPLEESSGRELEDIGSDYFNDLLWGSFFQDAVRDDDGNIYSCKMHDLMHDLAQSIAKELQHLINLRGKLRIEELENAKDVEEAKRANLRGKQHLHTLELYWTFDRGQVSAREEEGVLEALQPHTNLRHLNINYYGGSKFPSWMGNSSFTNLVTISLCDFSSISCECLPSFGKLWHLKELKINKVYGVKYFSTTDGSNYDEENTLGFPSLEKLQLDAMPDLEDWATSGQGNLSFLLELDISNCPKLRALPKLQSLKNLRLYEMPNLEDLLAGVEGNLSLLLELDIRNCPNLRALPKLQSLKKLKLDGMPNLQDLLAGVEGNLSSLLELDIRNCPTKLMALPKLPLLKELRLYEMPNLHDLSVGVEGNLSCLHKLVIKKCPKLRALPGFPSLEKLELDKMRALEDLSIGGEGNLSCLRELVIKNCPKLRALPELPSLEKLELYETPNLEDWLAIGEGNLSRLCEINIRNYSNLRWALPNLKRLALYSHDDDIPLPWEQYPSLEFLWIMNCVNITSLPDSIENLSTLKTLLIWNCPKLGSLPEGLKHLHALEELEIIDCPLLSERCKERGEDWPNIAHVARIKIEDWSI